MKRHKDFPNPCRWLDALLAIRHFELHKVEHVEQFLICFKLIVLCNCVTRITIKLQWSQASSTQYTMTSCDTSYFQQDEELLSEDTSEYDHSYTSERSFHTAKVVPLFSLHQCQKIGFGDGVERRFKESVSCTSLIQSLWTIYHQSTAEYCNVIL